MGLHDAEAPETSGSPSSDRAFDWRVAPRPGIPVRRQLSTRVAGLIRDGRLRPGARLPSVRLLAEEVGVHRNTVSAAYRELAAAGLVESRRGSGVYVRAPGSNGERLVESRQDRDREERVVRLVREALVTADSGPTVAVVEPLRRLRALLVRELELRTGLTVKPDPPLPTMTPRAQDRSDEPYSLVEPHLLDEPWNPPASKRDRGRLLLARPAVARRLPRRLDRDDRFVPLLVSGGTRELSMARGISGVGVVAVVTVSHAVRHLARVLHGGFAAAGLGLITPRPDDEAVVKRALQVADLVFADALCAEDPEIRRCTKAVPLWVVSELTVVRLRRSVRLRRAVSRLVRRPGP